MVWESSDQGGQDVQPLLCELVLLPQGVRGLASCGASLRKALVASAASAALLLWLLVGGAAPPSLVRSTWRGRPARATAQLFEATTDDGNQTESRCTHGVNDCSGTRCCSEPGLTCFRKNGFYAKCMSTCQPGLQPTQSGLVLIDDAPWTCEVLEPPDSDHPRASIRRQSIDSQATTIVREQNRTGCTHGVNDCTQTRCCAEPGLTCFQKNDFYAKCMSTCQSGFHPHQSGLDPKDEDDSPWTCKILGTPGDLPNATIRRENLGSEEQAAAAPAAGSCPCEAPCTYRGQTHSCAGRMGWMMDNNVAAAPESCEVAQKAVLAQCPSCSQCTFALACLDSTHLRPRHQDCHVVAAISSTTSPAGSEIVVSGDNETLEASAENDNETLEANAEARQGPSSPAQDSLSVGADADTTGECRVVEKGDECYGHVEWVFREGLRDHPEWYPDLTAQSSFEDAQAHLHKFDPDSTCPQPCPCHTAVEGSQCYENVRWAMREGFNSHPEWYKELTTSPGFEDTQLLLQRRGHFNCARPCRPPTWGLPSLFCFCVMRTVGLEPELVKSQLQRRASIFACNDYAVFSIGGNGSPFDLGAVEPQQQAVVTSPIAQAEDGMTQWGSWSNTQTFMNVYDALLKDGQFRQHDWVVKVDPDAVFFPERLRRILQPNTVRGGSGLYVENCNVPPHIKMQGSLEIISRQAFENYGKNTWRCKNELDWRSWGEDLYMQKCMEHLGVGPIQRFDIMSDKNCYTVSCSDKSKVSYHPFKTTFEYWTCWNQTTR